MERFHCHKLLLINHVKLLAHSCANLKFLCLDLQQDINHQPGDIDFDDDGLFALANSCSHLMVVYLNRRLHVGDAGIVSLVSLSKELLNLNLKGCIRVTDESLKAIGDSRIRILNLSGCCLITDLGLESLASGDLKNCLKVLDLSGCDMITDNGVIHLKQMVVLYNLNLSECGVHVTDSVIAPLLSSLPNIWILDLSWLINVTDISLLAIASNCFKLFRINLTGCKSITDDGLRAFSGYKNLSIKLF